MQKPKLVTEALWNKWTRRKKVKYLDLLWSYLTKEKHEKKCAWCGKKVDLQSDHIRSRSYYATRWRMENCLILCSGCHLFRKPSKPDEWVKMMFETIGEDLYDKLFQMSNTTVKADYDEVKTYLENIYLELPNESL